jgi:hypothetical protein
LVLVEHSLVLVLVHWLVLAEHWLEQVLVLEQVLEQVH